MVANRCRAKITGTEHERIDKAYTVDCRNNWKLVAFSKGQRELEVGAWLCQHACSFVLFDSKALDRDWIRAADDF